MHWMNVRMQRGNFNNVMMNEPRETEPRWWLIRCQTDLPVTHLKLLLFLHRHKTAGSIT